MSISEYDKRSREFLNHDERVDHRSLYATHLPGRGNSGHAFGSSLTEAERYDVIEFLKSLSGPNMPSVRELRGSAFHLDRHDHVGARIAETTLAAGGDGGCRQGVKAIAFGRAAISAPAAL